MLLSDVNDGIQVGGRFIKTVHLISADDQANLASLVKGQQLMIDKNVRDCSGIWYGEKQLSHVTHFS